MSATTEVQVIWTLGEMADLEPGTRIVTNHNKLLRLEKWGLRERLHWVEPGKATTPQAPLVTWLPVIVPPPLVDNDLEEAKGRIRGILGGEVVDPQ